MDRLSCGAVTVHQATRVGPVAWIVLNDITLRNTHEDIVKRKPIGLSFLVCMVSNAYSIVAYGINDVLQVHPIIPFGLTTGKRLKPPG